MVCNTYPFSALMLLVRQQEVHPACKMLDVGSDDLTGALNVLSLFHTDTSTRSEHSRQTTGAYVYHCAFTLARARALAEITRTNVHVHSRCQRSTRAFTRVAEQEVGYLSIISINFFTLLAQSIRCEYLPRTFAVSTRRSVK